MSEFLIKEKYDNIKINKLKILKIFEIIFFENFNKV